MILTSFNFLIFFPLVVLLFYLCPSKFRWAYLLIVSLFFYINVKPVYALLLVGVTLATYACTMLMSLENSESRKECWLIVDILLVLSPLLFFKYFNFINEVISNTLGVMGLQYLLPSISYILPVGISFYTFMAIGYAIDVYNEEIEVEKNLGILGLFISFFPLILSGPIERAGNMLPQYRNFKPVIYDNIIAGLKLMLWGYFMKLVVADRLGIYINAVYNNIDQHNGTTLAFASLLYPFQVYGDLGGYSLIVIGVAKCLGIDVIQNFKRPFFASSMSEFWRRWHISLIKWLTNYIYTPLSFKYRRWGVAGIVIALMITFLISGIWHGAAFTFIIWGLIQGIYLGIEAITNKKRLAFEKKHNLTHKGLYIAFWCIITYLLFTFSQIFGHASSTSEAVEIISKIVTEHGRIFIDITTLFYSFIGIAMLFIKDWCDEFYPTKFQLFNNENIVVRYVAYVSISVLVLLIGVLDGGQFIYFQF